MKNPLFAFIGLGLLLATASAYAQTGVVKANVPFNFIVNKTELPAGEYMIHSLGLTGSALTMQSTDKKIVTVIVPNACESLNVPRSSKLLFHRYGAQYFLAQIWTEGNSRGRELPRSGREKEVAMDYTAQDVVVVAALR
jgi:hypothetical protein